MSEGKVTVLLSGSRKPKEGAGDSLEQRTTNVGLSQPSILEGEAETSSMLAQMPHRASKEQTFRLGSHELETSSETSGKELALLSLASCLHHSDKGARLLGF